MIFLFFIIPVLALFLWCFYRLWVNEQRLSWQRAWGKVHNRLCTTTIVYARLARYNEAEKAWRVAERAYKRTSKYHKLIMNSYWFKGGVHG